MSIKHQIKTILGHGPAFRSQHKFEDGQHLVKFYEDVDSLAQSVCNYIVPGLIRGDGVIIIATHSNIRTFEKLLENRAIDVRKVKTIGQLVFLNANETLESFMLDGSPDKTKFEKVIGAPLKKMKTKYPTIRAYGEMVNILLEQENNKGMIKLENFWNDLSQSHKFSLLCAYSKSHFEDELSAQNFHEICCTHSHVLSSQGVLTLK
jgi:hypothetical protein